MWRNPLLIANSGASIQLTITSDTYIGNLHSFLGSPSGPQSVVITVDACDIGDVQVLTHFAAGSTFEFICINGGRILGMGGDGGTGATRTSPYGALGGHGTEGRPAILSTGFNINVDVDDGYLLGGGGGGGGGASWWISVYGFSGGWSGGGGGGGQGYEGGDKGIQGSGGSPVAQAGSDGTRTSSGVGGAGGISTMFGGDGGKFGSGGQAGGASPTNTQQINGVFKSVGGVGGNAGPAFFAAPDSGFTLSLTGAKSEATLRSESRIKGETGGTLPIVINDSIVDDSNNAGSAASSVHGFRFQSDGDLAFLSAAADDVKTIYWENTTLVGVGAAYEIRAVERTTTIDRIGTWDAGAADNTWVSLSTNRTWSFTNTTPARNTAQLFEIRRNDVPGNPDDEIMATYWLLARDTG